MQETSRLVVTFLLNSFWQIVVLAVAAGLCAWIGKRVSARFQHGVWAAALTLGLLVPVLVLARSFYTAGSSAPVTVASPVSETGVRSSSQSADNPASSGALYALWAEMLKPQERRIPFGAGLAFLLAASYLAFLLSRVIRFWSAWKNVREVAGCAAQVALSPALESAVERCRIAFELTDVTVLCSSTLNAPATLGIRRPLIVLPEALIETGDVTLLAAVIGHEMAHIKRRDFAFNLIYELLYLPISFHPAAALVKRRIAQTRELACDELVTERLLGPSEYARALVTVASRVTGVGRPSYTLGVFDADNLEERVMKLTDRRSRASARVGKLILISAVGILTVTSVIASAYSLNTGPLEPQQEKARVRKIAAATEAKGYPLQAQIPAELKQIVGTWKGSFDITPSNAEVSHANRIRNSEVKSIHWDVQVDFGVADGKLTATYLMYQKVTRNSGEETFEMNRLALVNPQFDGNTVTGATEAQQKENEMDAARTGQPGNRAFKMKLTGDGQMDAWHAAGGEDAPHIALKKEVPGNEPKALGLTSK